MVDGLPLVVPIKLEDVLSPCNDSVMSICRSYVNFAYQNFSGMACIIFQFEREKERMDIHKA